MSINTKKIIKNAFRISKVRGQTAVRIRVPGGHLDSKHLIMLKTLADEFGNGTLHITTRQGFEIPGINMSDISIVKEHLKLLISEIENECDIVLEEPENGYPSAGTRNVSACIGNRVCKFANIDSTLLAQKIEKIIYPNDYHLKIAITGCPNDCIKAHMQDIGIIGNVIPEYNKEKCIACESCLDNCRKKITNALSIENYQIYRDDEYCLKCGECILKCPTGAFYRGKKLYRIIIGGRTGKRNPRIANTFIKNASEKVVLEICRNIYKYIDRHINRKLPKEHVGYIIDRTGYDTFAKEILENLILNKEVQIRNVNNPGYFYERRY